MVAICWDHWRPAGWTRVFPFEVFLFFFLVMTGYLITGSLLRERDRGKARGGAWRLAALQTYQIRRGLRILAPYYAALALALLVSPDVRHALGWYVFHLSNLHMAFLRDWPAGTNHFWSLSMQQQFYLVWPLVIWFLPRKWLLPAILLFSAVGPVSRSFHDAFAVWCPRPEVLTWFSFDYFGIGAIVRAGRPPRDVVGEPGLALDFDHRLRRLRRAVRCSRHGLADVWAALAAANPARHCALRLHCGGYRRVWRVGRGGCWSTPRSSASAGFPTAFTSSTTSRRCWQGKCSGFCGAMSFRAEIWEIVRVGLFAAVTWGLTLASWRWIELPLQGVRSRIAR